MTIHVSKDVENAINAAVRRGQFSSAGEMIETLVREYDQSSQPQSGVATRREAPGPRAAKPSSPGANRPKVAAGDNTPHTESEALQHMLEIGLITGLPDTDADFDDPDDQPIT